MDTKRLILAIALSMVVILLWQFLFMPKRQPQKPPQDYVQQPRQEQVVSGEQAVEKEKEAKPGVTDKPGVLPDIFSEQKKKKAPVEEKTLLEAVKEDLTDLIVKDVVVETDLFRAVFTNKGAGLKSFVLKNYDDDTRQPLELISTKVQEKFGTNEVYPFYLSPFDDENKKIFLDVNTQNFKYKGGTETSVYLTEGQTKEIVFKYANVERNIFVLKRFFISGSSYVMQVECQVIKDGQVIDAPFIFGPDLENNVGEGRIMQTGLRIGAYDGEDVKEKVFSGLSTEKIGDLVELGTGTFGSGYWWVSYDTNYFGAIFKLPGKIDYAVIKKIEKEKKQKELYSYIIVTSSKPLDVYLGPKDEQILGAVEKQYGFKDVTQVVSYGWAIFGSIARIMLKGIVLIHGIIPNYGWALVFFTIFIKILLFPLTYASSVSMAKMQSLQPKIQAIKKKYKNLKDPEQRRKMNMETMQLYKSEKVNPAGGCLPLLLQMPILIAFFRLLPISINFRHEPWILWITDLSVKDPIYALPILMGVTQIIVSKMSPTSGDATQKKLMYILPVVFVFFFMNYSAGLNLYWFIANLLQIAQQHIINKKIFHQKKEEEKVRRAQKRKKGGKGR
ncbi:MAG: membrane protein insertase YidC [Candidatus Aminicenantes bacterium]|nr:membrane protein insertase YidC [Candidatus Aminicenantes bacterium]NIM77520.1 membrane protein insertase YidC [Candidatus Aminicenantes bacterium]NIN19817.1 membrane protein insertase YidC [Candidatus Aminicenantes bacterium]NIN40712.1 membrane protein insertase YidC [Candidatus Aminicenantes bacterium]NIN86443.1 membrane protein insertase YidC [Candidatus Aminicenantes bacterium]